VTEVGKSVQRYDDEIFHAIVISSAILLADCRAKVLFGDWGYDADWLPRRSRIAHDCLHSVKKNQ